MVFADASHPAGGIRPPLAETAQRALSGLAALCPAAGLDALRADELLMERAWLTGARFADGRSTSGLTRLLPTRDGALAIALVRPEDWELLPAWLELEGHWTWGDGHDGWRRLAVELGQRDTPRLAERGRLLGLALAAVGAQQRPRDLSLTHYLPSDSSAGGCSQPEHEAAPLVVDLSALWAGPLCTHLLALCGADVIKVESTHRPDGARAGNSHFYHLLNQRKRSVALDLTSPGGRHLLTRLIERADIVIESSRPRALRQMGIDAETILGRQPRLIWVSITGYGRAEPAANWVAFGDDAGVAGGLSDVMKRATGGYQFAGDAIADPLTGIHAALAAWHAWREQRGGLIELALADVAAWCLAEETARVGEAAVAGRFAEWWRHVRRAGPCGGYHSRAVACPAARLGADTDAVLDGLGIRC